MDINATHAVFWRKYPVVTSHQGRYEVVEYRAYKATNRHTLRRLKSMGWTAEGPLDEVVLRTEEECQRAAERLNQRQSATLEGKAPTTSMLLLKPLGKGN